MKLTVAILNFNGEKLLQDCLDSVLAQDWPKDMEILIVDNGSEKPPIIDTHGHTVRVETLPSNCVNIGGQNKCFELANGDTVLFVSNDVRIGFGLEAIFPWLVIYDQVMPIIFWPGGIVQSSGGVISWPIYGLNRKADIFDCDYIPSICYAMQKRTWEKVGKFNEQLPGAYEDVDMGLKLRRKACIGAATVIHLGNATLRYTAKDKWRFHQARLQVIDKHFHGIDRLLRRSAVQALDYIFK